MNNPNANGYNPLRWDCKIRGCFNLIKRPKIERFCGAFPGKINFGDCDGMVEVNGRILILEWKEAPMRMPMGQSIMYGRITIGYFVTVLCVAGDAETMRVTHFAWFKNGVWIDWKPGNFDDAYSWVKAWAKWAQSNRADWSVTKPKPAIA
jgi:hypothetical protein